MIQEFDQVLGSADIAAEDPNGLGKCSHLDIDAPMQTEMIDGAAPVAAENTRRVRVVDHHDGAMPFGLFHQFRERRRYRRPWKTRRR